MKILVVGASGMIGGEVARVLSDRGHEVIHASRHTGSKVDIEDPDSISDLYRRIGRVDAVACAAGSAPMATLEELTYTDFRDGFARKAVEMYDSAFPGFPPAPAAAVAQAYVTSIGGVQTGQKFRVGC